MDFETLYSLPGLAANCHPVSHDDSPKFHPIADTRLIDMEEMITDDDVAVVAVELSSSTEKTATPDDHDGKAADPADPADEHIAENTEQSVAGGAARADTPLLPFALPGPLANLTGDASPAAETTVGALAPTLFMGAFQVMRMEMPAGLPTLPGGLPALPGGLSALIPGAVPEA